MIFYCKLNLFVLGYGSLFDLRLLRFVCFICTLEIYILNLFQWHLQRFDYPGDKPVLLVSFL